jgi:hypothetical protein
MPCELGHVVFKLLVLTVRAKLNADGSDAYCLLSTVLPVCI